MIDTSELINIYNKILDMNPCGDVIFHKKEVLYLMHKLIETSKQNDKTESANK